MDYPEVSIISIFYNRGQYVEDSVRSLIAQTYPNLKIYLIDDCSDDITLSQLYKLAEEDKRISIVSNKVNKGFTLSLIDQINDLTSEYIAIHGSGDISLPNRVEKQVSFMLSHKDAAVCCTGVTNRSVNNISKTIKLITTEDLLKRNMINHGTALLKRSVYKKVGGYRAYFTTRQDIDLWYRISENSEIYFLPEKLYTWIHLENSVSNQLKNSQIPLFLAGFAKFLSIERSRTGIDLLEKFGDQAALMFNPKLCSPLIRKYVFKFSAKKRWNEARQTINSLIIINNNKLYRALLKVLISILPKEKQDR